MNINIDSIMSKVSAYAQSSAGKEKMNKRIQQYVSSGVKQTAAGDKILTEDKMWEAVSKFLYVMRVTAAEYGLPESVMEHINGLESAGQIRKTPDGYEIALYFEGDLHRDSLEDGSDYYGGKYGGYTGEGINNIIALFNNGAHAKNYAYGWWNGHKATGDGVLRSGVGTDFAWVRSKKEREPLHFIQQAVQDFNANYGADYGVTAIAGTAYE